MYIQRTAQDLVNRYSEIFKVVLVTGARQVGKTSLLKHCGPERNYVSLDDLSERELAVKEPKLFLERHKAPLIIDEIQYAPSLLSYIKLIVDSSEEKGRYWLTGSQQFHLMKNVSESLVGRVGIIDLMGFSLAEMQGNPKIIPFFPSLKSVEEKRATSRTYTSTEIFKIIFNGSFPALNSDKAESDRDAFYSAYIQTYLERDIRDLASVSNELKFLHFIRAVAARTGQVLKYSEIARDVEISEPTAKTWLSLLVSSNMVYLLEPYFRNLSKRMTRMPKIYFLDTGLCAYLTGWSSAEVIEKGAMNGAFFETFVVSEILKNYRHTGQRPFFNWYRDASQREIDLLIERDRKLHPIEIKLTANPTAAMVKNFKVLENPGFGCLVCMRDTDIPLTANVSAIPVGYIE